MEGNGGRLLGEVEPINQGLNTVDRVTRQTAPANKDLSNRTSCRPALLDLH